jgi:hypothetical protein
MMTKISILLMSLMLVLGPGPAMADWQDWEDEDRYLFGAWAAVNVIDAAQTLDIRNHPGMREINPLMPHQPQRRDVALHTLGSLALGYWFIDNIDARYRKTVLGTLIGFELILINHNRVLGLHFAY